MRVIQTDCTLRDGGFYTNWDFDREISDAYFDLIDKLPIDFLEIGYAHDDIDDYYGEFFYLPNSTIDYVRSRTSKNLAVMLDAKRCQKLDCELVFPRLMGRISMVRIATDPDKIEFSLQLAKKIKGYGFSVAISLMYISKVNEHSKVFQHLSGIEEYVDVLNMVDSYGALYPHKLKDITKLFKRHTTVPLGFHGHNNLELAFANTLTAFALGVEYVDTTLLGLGRGAGNMKTELLLTHLKTTYSIPVDLDILGQLVTTFIPLYEKHRWGTNLAYMVSGSYQLPQKEVMEALEINRYTLSGIINFLRKENDNKLAMFPKRKDCESSVLLVGGGESVLRHSSALMEFLERNPEIVIVHLTQKHSHQFASMPNKQIFGIVGDAFLALKETNANYDYVFEPSPRYVDSPAKPEKNFFELGEITCVDKHFDSPLTLGLQIATDLQASEILVAGFDGYTKLKQKKELFLMQENQSIFSIFSGLDVTSLTPTEYRDVVQKSVYGYLVGSK